MSYITSPYTGIYKVHVLRLQDVLNELVLCVTEESMLRACGPLLRKIQEIASMSSKLGVSLSLDAGCSWARPL